MVYCTEMNCGYFYQGEDELFPSCHYPSNSPWPAPCDYEDNETDDYDDMEDEDYDD